MTGPHLTDELSGLLDGELSPAEEADARAHLDTCAFCTSELAAFARTRSLVRDLPPVDPPGVLGLPAARRSGSRRAGSRRSGSRRAAGRWPLVPAVAAAAAAVLVLPSVAAAERSVSPAVANLVGVHAAAGLGANPQRYQAHLRVEWHDRAGAHTDELDVAGPQSLPAAIVPMSAKYDVDAAGDAAVADRPARVMSVREGGRLVERVHIDAATGLVLRRELYDAAGGVVRQMSVETLRLGSAAPAAVAQADVDVPAPFAAPRMLAGDYVRVGAEVRGRVLHVLYSDGLHALSVFAQVGRLAAAEGGERVSVGGRPARSYAWPGGDVLMWDVGGLVYTAVSDAPAGDVRAAAATLPGARALPAAERLRRACRKAVEALLG
jgi:hypothetical protein